MHVSDYLKKECCIMDISAEDKEGVIREIAEIIDSSGKVKDKDQFVSDVLAREGLGSTGIGNNVAIPHARTSAVKKFVIGFGKSDNGIEFKALDGEKVNLVFLMGADPEDLNHYLRILAELSKLLMNNAFRQALLETKSAEEVIEIIRRYE